MSLGENVRWLRTSRGMTQAELAAKTRVNHHHPTPSYISRLEHGQIDPRWRTIRSIAKALQVKPWQLVAEITENVEFWSGYLALPAERKREIQRMIAWR